MKANPSVRRAIVATLTIFVGTLAACSSNSNKDAKHDESQHSPAEHAAATASSGTPVFEDPKATAVYQHYLHLKDALVNSNGAEAQTGAAALQTALTEAGNEKGADLAGKVASVSDVTAQRAELEALTAEVESVVKSTKLTAGVVYKQYCPMANNDKGGYWLSNDSEIKNPYFGESMISCGETKEEIK